MELHRGETWMFDCIITDDEQHLIDLNDFIVRFTVKHNSKATMIYADNNATGVTITALGKCTIQLFDTADFPVGAAKAQLLIKDSDDIVQISESFDISVIDPLYLL